MVVVLAAVIFGGENRHEGRTSTLCHWSRRYIYIYMYIYIAPLPLCTATGASTLTCSRIDSRANASCPLQQCRQPIAIGNKY